MVDKSTPPNDDENASDVSPVTQDFHDDNDSSDDDNSSDDDQNEVEQHIQMNNVVENAVGSNDFGWESDSDISTDDDEEDGPTYPVVHLPDGSFEVQTPRVVLRPLVAEINRLRPPHLNFAQNGVEPNLRPSIIKPPKGER